MTTPVIEGHPGFPGGPRALGGVGGHVGAPHPVIAFGQQPCGFFPRRYLVAKIRTARAFRHPYMLVVGPKDAEAGTVSVRSRDAGELGAMPRAEFVAKVLAESAEPR